MGDLDPLVEVVRRDQVTVLQRVHPRVLEVPDRPGLADRSPLETDGAWLFAEELRILSDLAFRGRALFFGHVRGQRELRDIARHDLR